MTRSSKCGRIFTRSWLLAILLLLASVSNGVSAANEITGSARNSTRNQPTAGDEVILVRLDQGMQEEAHARTDAQGRFTLRVRYPDKPYLVRVVHQRVNYDQQASVGDVVSIDVFDADHQVPGITGSIEIVRAGTRGNSLHVSDMYELKNNSSPPLTQAGESTFAVYLPAHAKIDSVFAAGPGKIGVTISAKPVPGEPGHYTVNFPLRPGATKFAFNYDLPYDGHVAFETKRMYPVQQLAVMFPPTMKFSSTSRDFQILATGNSKYQVEAASQLAAGAGPGFEISGSGALPPIGEPKSEPARSSVTAVPSPTTNVPSGATSLSLTGANSWIKQSGSSSERLVLGGLSVLILSGCVLFVLRVRRARSALGPRAATGFARATQIDRPTPLLDNLKDELLQLELDRLRGSISSKKYAATKRALRETVKRALAN